MAALEGPTEVGFDWLDAFLEAVDAEGFRVDTEQRVRVYGLCARLAAEGRVPADKERCGRLLIPILAGSPAQQAACDSVLKRVLLQENHELSPQPGEAPDKALPEDDTRQWIARLRPAKVLIAVCIALLVAVTVAVAIVYGPRLFDPAGGDVPEPPSVAVAFAPDELWQDWLNRYPIEELAPPRQSPWNRTWRWWYTEYDAVKWAAVAMPAALYLVLLAWLFHQLLAYLRREALSRNLRSLEWRFGDPGARFGDRTLLGELQPLRKLARVHIPMLDAERSAIATAESAGRLRPRFREIGIPVDFIAVIDRRSPRDHLAEFDMQLVRTLRDAGLSVEVFEFDRDPRLCRAVRGGELLRLEALVERHGDSVIAMFATAQQLLDPARYGVLRAAASLKSAWRCVLVTPQGDFAESALENRLARELDLSIVRSTPAGMRKMVTALLSRGSAVSPRLATISAMGSMEDALSERPERWMQTVPPRPRDRRRMLELLRNGLGSGGLTLLAAACVYPEFRWPITVGIKAAARIGKSPAKILDDELLAVSRLPWMRRGWMPEWTRRLLQQTLSGEERRRVYRTILAAMGLAEHERRALERLSLAIPDDGPRRERMKVDRVMVDFLLPVLKSVHGLFVLPRSQSAWSAKARLRKIGIVAAGGLAGAIAIWFLTLSLLPINECDLLGASRADNLAVGPGRSHIAMQLFYAKQALKACELAVTAAPRNQRYRYQYARALGTVNPVEEHIVAMEAASLGYPAAHNLLGAKFMDGDGVETDLVKARAYLDEAIQMGNTYSLINLANIDGREGNHKLRFQRLRRFVDGGGSLTGDLAKLYRDGLKDSAGEEIVTKDLKEYRRLLELGVARADGDAAAQLAWAYEKAILDGDDANIDWNEVERLYLLSTRWFFNEEWAAYNLANLYRDGRNGIDENLERATYWYVFAAKFGHADANAALTELILDGRAVFKEGYYPPTDRLFSCVNVRALARGENSYWVSAQSRHTNILAILGNGKTDLDLEIRGRDGSEKCTANGSTDRESCFWLPDQADKFKARITNLGEDDNDYRLCVTAGNTIDLTR